MSPGEKVIGGWSSLCPPSTLNREPNAGLPTLQKWQLGTAGKKNNFLVQSIKVTEDRI
jgi:hypothetical protein